ncbi:MAG TPA: hypothetical protein DCX00_00560 [Flavobacteriales bacterium]|nr:hypothetical protein [Flavobacteriales bacterium]
MQRECNQWCELLAFFRRLKLIKLCWNKLKIEEAFGVYQVGWSKNRPRSPPCSVFDFDVIYTLPFQSEK